VDARNVFFCSTNKYNIEYIKKKMNHAEMKKRSPPRSYDVLFNKMANAMEPPFYPAHDSMQVLHTLEYLRESGTEEKQTVDSMQEFFFRRLYKDTKEDTKGRSPILQTMQKIAVIVQYGLRIIDDHRIENVVRIGNYVETMPMVIKKLRDFVKQKKHCCRKTSTEWENRCDTLQKYLLSKDFLVLPEKPPLEVLGRLVDIYYDSSKSYELLFENMANTMEPPFYPVRDSMQVLHTLEYLRESSKEDKHTLDSMQEFYFQRLYEYTNKISPLLQVMQKFAVVVQYGLRIIDDDGIDNVVCIHNYVETIPEVIKKLRDFVNQKKYDCTEWTRRCNTLQQYLRSKDFLANPKRSPLELMAALAGQAPETHRCSTCSALE
jgi:conjugal transfer/entry exclusion protein